MEDMRRETGVALVVVLILLSILSMLAIAGASTATAELAMAGNDQYRRRAADAASDGIEQAVSQLNAGAGASTIATTTHTATSRAAGDEADLPQSSTGKLIGHHYVIESTGSAERGATDRQTQGVLVIVPTAGIDTFQREGSGLTGGSGP